MIAHDQAKGDPAEPTQEVLEEGFRRTLAVLEKTQEALGIPSLPEAEDCLRRGGGVHFSYYTPKTSEAKAQIYVTLYDETGLVSHKDSYLLSIDPPPRGFSFLLERGHTAIRTLPGEGAVFRGQVRKISGSFGVVANRPFFRGQSIEDCRDFAHFTKALRPILFAMGITDIEAALDSLLLLKEGDVQVKNGYILAKKKNFWFLNRGPILGDFDLDRRLVRGEPVTLSFPGGVEITFKVSLDKGFAETDEIYIPYTHIRWGDETVVVGGGSRFCVGAVDGFSLSRVIKSNLEVEIERFEKGADSHLADRSPEMLAFLKAFVRHEDPFCALAEGTFAFHVKAEFFLDF
jgi:hypothetical protein